MANDDDDDDAAFNFVKMCDSLTKLGNVPPVAAADRLTIFRNLWPAPAEKVGCACRRCTSRCCTADLTSIDSLLKVVLGWIWGKGKGRYLSFAIN